jgi:hypothetical protein
MDWTFGRLLAVHLKPKGSSYTATNPLKSYTYPKGPEASEDVEVFLSGKGMPLTDLEFGKDGAMYFTVGGRGTQGGLYRVSWAPNEEQRKTAAADDASVKAAASNKEAASGREILRKLNAGAQEPWSQLGSADRFLRFAARNALESKPASQWASSGDVGERSPRCA